MKIKLKDIDDPKFGFGDYSLRVFYNKKWITTIGAGNTLGSLCQYFKNWYTYFAEESRPAEVPIIIRILKLPDWEIQYDRNSVGINGIKIELSTGSRVRDMAILAMMENQKREG